jgi:hypothetical protein
MVEIALDPLELWDNLVPILSRFLAKFKLIFSPIMGQFVGWSWGQFWVNFGDVLGWFKGWFWANSGADFKPILVPIFWTIFFRFVPIKGANFMSRFWGSVICQFGGQFLGWFAANFWMIKCQFWTNFGNNFKPTLRLISSQLGGRLWGWFFRGHRL